MRNAPLSAEGRRLVAIAAANQVFDLLARIELQRELLQRLLANHDHAYDANAQRRDCAAFHDRITELGLIWKIDRELDRMKDPT